MNKKDNWYWICTFFTI